MPLDPSDRTLVMTHQGPDLPEAPSEASLVIIYGAELGRSHPLHGERVLGRDEGTDIPLPGNEISRRHARVFEQSGHWHVEDLGSTNGTLVNGELILGTRRLRNGDFLKLGGVVLKFLEGGNLEALYFEEIYKLTILDGLTGVPNKRYLLEFLEREVSRAHRHRRALTVALLDIDHFKKVNDTHGHLVGDLALQNLARTARTFIRLEEVFARFGGEEFVLVLPETDLRGAHIIGDRLRQAVENLETPMPGGNLRFTVSLGLGVLEHGMSYMDLLGAADGQLYRAKEAGRNRVMSVQVP